MNLERVQCKRKDLTVQKQNSRGVSLREQVLEAEACGVSLKVFDEGFHLLNFNLKMKIGHVEPESSTLGFDLV